MSDRSTTISLPYGEGSIDVRVPSRFPVRMIDGRPPLPVRDAREALRLAIARPVQSEGLAAHIPAGGRVSVLVPDPTRGRGATGLLPSLLDFLESSGCGPDRVDIVLASGMHRRVGGAELDEHIGGEIVSLWSVSQHDASDAASCVFAGHTPSGTPCFYNRKVLDSSLVILLGTVSYHYFAGFGGGRKLLLPGISAAETILVNHRLSLGDDPGEGLADGCRSGNLEGNPVHEDMLAGARLVRTPLFCINVVADGAGRILFVNAGDLEKSHRAACGFLEDHFSVPLRSRADVVVASAGGFPKDINLLQTHKAVRHAARALAPGGLLLMAARCNEGIGSDSYAAAFCEGRERVPDVVRREYTLNSQTAVSTYGLTERFTIRLRTDLESETVKRFGFDPWREEETGELLERAAPARVIVLKHAANFIPVAPETT